MGRSLRVLVGIVALGLISLMALAPFAGGFVYYGDTNNFSIGRAGLDGRSPHDSFISLGGLPTAACGVAVDGRYVYWGNKVLGEIGRAPIDGSGKPNPSFIVGASEPCGLATYGGHLYWVNQSMAGSIGRADLTGPLHVHENFVPSEQGSGRTDLYNPCGVAVDQTGIYWTDALSGAVGHANLDGSGEGTLLPGGSAQGCGVALGGGYVYWAHNPYLAAASIGRALESGLHADSTYITGLNGPCGAAVYSHYLYFADGATIDRTDLTSPNPTAATEQIVLGTKNACGVAVDGLYTGRLVVIARPSGPGGTVRLTVSASDPGVLVVRQMRRSVQLVRDGRFTLRRPGRATITLRPTAAGEQRLATHRSVEVRVLIAYTPTGGVATTTTTTVSLARR